MFVGYHQPKPQTVLLNVRSCQSESFIGSLGPWQSRNIHPEIKRT